MNKTSVLLGHCRESLQLWRTPEEQYAPDCTRLCWNRALEFMFWGSSLYDRKGPCHCWKNKTAKEKKVATGYLDRLNKELEPAAQEEWALINGM